MNEIISGVNASMRSLILIALLTFQTSAFSSDEAKPVSDNSQQIAATRSVMDQLLASLSTILPYAMKRSDFSDPTHREQILAELKKMDDSTQALSQHIKKYDHSYEFVAKSMSRDISESFSRYKQGSYTEANYLLLNLSENCVSCHMKVPDPGHAPRMDAFFKNIRISELTPPERAKLQVAMRQFDDALNTWEKMFATSDKPGSLFEMDALSEYLKVVVRVKMDLSRGKKTLDSIAAKAIVPQFVRREVKAWSKSLASLEPKLKQKSDKLKLAKSIIKTAQRNMEYPLDRVGFIDYVAASGLLSQYLSEGHSPLERAEAYYQLGVTEALIGRSVWVTQTASYLEAAIRTAPHSKIARSAFDAYEQQAILEYSGSRGIDIPDDVRIIIEELRRLAAAK